MSDGVACEKLNEAFGLGGGVRFEPGRGGLIRASVRTDVATGELYLHGAHVTAYQPRGHEPVLFLSGNARFEAGKAIRGGVPICFPWFAEHPSDRTAPMHGLVRTMPWRVVASERRDADVALTLATEVDGFDLRYEAAFGPSLRLTLRARNTTDRPKPITDALHTYFAVGDVRRVELEGLGETDYLDKNRGFERFTQNGEALTFTGPTDRVYVDTESVCLLRDPALGRRIHVGKSGSRSTVVWNPWDVGARAMGDLVDEDWPRMLCVETANAFDNALTVAPGQTHELGTLIRAEPL